MSSTAISTATLIPPSDSQTYTFGERAVLALFRGAGGALLGLPGDSGIDVLNDRLQNTFADYYWVSQVFDSFEGNIFSFEEIGSPQGLAFINQFDEIEALGLIGYSAGGLSAIRIANTLIPRNQALQTVDLLVQIDSFDPLTGESPEDEVLPNTVVKGINYYQNANNFDILQPDFDLFDLQGAQQVVGSENINAEDLLGDRSITHLTIAENPQLQTEILSNIQAFVLEGLTFDQAGQLRFQGATEVFNNILSLSSEPEADIGQALIDTSFDVTPDVSFETRFEFRLQPITTTFLPGFSFIIQPASDTLTESTSKLEIAFSPQALSPFLLDENSVGILNFDRPAEHTSQAIAPFDLDSGEPLTAWLEYEGTSDQLSVFLSDTLTQPETPLLSYEIDLFDVVGSEAEFGFQAAIGQQGRQGEILTWQFETASNDSFPVVPPDTYLNFGLTQQAAETLLGLSLPATPFEVGGLNFTDLFDEAFYRQLNPDVVGAVADGAFSSGYDHFIQLGWLEGRRPSSLYDEAFYLETNPDVEEAIENDLLSSGFEHFAGSGHLEGRDPSALFSQATYLAENNDVAIAVAEETFLSGFEHYIEHGAAESRIPQLLLFQESDYLTTYSDVADAVAEGAFADGFDHYLLFGCREGRNPNPFFNEASYLDSNPDIAEAVLAGEFPCGWWHFALKGRFEGRQ